MILQWANIRYRTWKWKLFINTIELEESGRSIDEMRLVYLFSKKCKCNFPYFRPIKGN